MLHPCEQHVARCLLQESLLWGLKLWNNYIQLIDQPHSFKVGEFCLSEEQDLMLCDYLRMEDTGLVLTNLEIMFLLISFRIMKGMKGSDWVEGLLSL